MGCPIALVQICLLDFVNPPRDLTLLVEVPQHPLLRNLTLEGWHAVHLDLLCYFLPKHYP